MEFRRNEVMSYNSNSLTIAIIDESLFYLYNGEEKKGVTFTRIGWKYKNENCYSYLRTNISPTKAFAELVELEINGKFEIYAKNRN